MKKKPAVDPLIATNDAYCQDLLAKNGYELIDEGNGHFDVVRIKTGSTTRLEADNLSDALFEAWHLVKP